MLACRMYISTQLQIGDYCTLSLSIKSVNYNYYSNEFLKEILRLFTCHVYEQLCSQGSSIRLVYDLHADIDSLVLNVLLWMGGHSLTSTAAA